MVTPTMKVKGAPCRRQIGEHWSAWLAIDRVTNVTSRPPIPAKARNHRPHSASLEPLL
jgi:hypothetical protein